jgi:uncharacterized membrane protein YciS (DUF1049 family)
MKLFKWLSGCIILAIIGLFIYQNLGTFKSDLPFSLDLIEKLEWKHHLYTIIAISAGLGLVLGILLMLKPYLKIRRTLAGERQEKQQSVESVQKPAGPAAEPASPRDAPAEQPSAAEPS